MTIFRNNIKRMIRKKANLIFLILVPVAAILMAMLMNTSSNNIPPVAIVDNDNTKYTHELIDSLKGKCRINMIKEEEIQGKLLDFSTGVALVIDKGLEDDIIKGKDVRIKSYRIQESESFSFINFAVDGYINESKIIAAAAKGDIEKFYKGMERYNKGNVKSVEKSIDNTDEKVNKTSTVIGFLIMSMLFLSSLTAMTLLEDKKNRTLYRVTSAPITTRNFMFQNVLSYFAIMIFQVLLIVFIMTNFFHFYLGPNPVNLVILLIIFSAVCVSLGMAITSISKDIRQASTLMSLIATPICMLGGCWWPRELMPDWLIKVGDFVPTTWIIKSTKDVLYGRSLASVSNEIIVMCLFALVLFLLGSWRKVDIAK